MNSFLIKTFVKDYENINDPQVRQNYGKFAGIVGILSNVLLCVMKVGVGIISNSIAIIADGINNLADASSSVITLIGFKLAAMPEDEDHPYGHARIEYLTGLFVSAIIILVGVKLLGTSIDKIFHPEILDVRGATVAVLIIAIAIKTWQATFNMTVGKRINSTAVIATGTDSRNDVIATSAVLISVIVYFLTNICIDGYMGCLVALFIIWSGISLVRETINPLLGEAPDDELVKAIALGALKYEGVLGTHDLIVHNYGPGKIFASIHVEVDARNDIMESHDIVDNIEKDLSRELGIVLVAHMDPIKTDDPLLDRIKEIICEEVNEIKGVSNIHDFRMVPGPTHTNIIFDAVIDSGCKLKESEIRQIIEDRVRKEGDNYFVVITFDKGYSGIKTQN